LAGHRDIANRTPLKTPTSFNTSQYTWHDPILLKTKIKCKPSQGGITHKYGSPLSHLKRLELPYEEPHLGSQECNIIEASARSEHVESIK